ncbi:MAG TPA: 16S rRNA (cytosine(1402)-N(4))-methyltransferase RsmH [Bryobacterales bacterium]|nr:16S rRNA (cytosine(1402)-N(4))-methyltransferase RsmH [Bryobacterales bacterium]
MAHVPVLLRETIEWLNIRPDGTYIDCTLGAGGHARAIAERLTAGRLIAIDRDPSAVAAARERLAGFGGRISFFQASFAGLREVCEKVWGQVGAMPIDGIVADLGVSREQLETPARGFSFLTDGPLDMRMDPNQELTAERIVNRYGEKPLADLIYRFGEERRSRRITRAIVRARPLQGTRQLAEVIERAAPRTRERIHPATRTFQALRIAVNDELGQLETLLETAPPLLAPGGRFVLISFHSLEDRAVKQALRRWAARKVLAILTKHVVRPGEEEARANPASRSAKLRAAERTAKELVN